MFFAQKTLLYDEVCLSLGQRLNAAFWGVGFAAGSVSANGHIIACKVYWRKSVLLFRLVEIKSSPFSLILCCGSCSGLVGWTIEFEFVDFLFFLTCINWALASWIWRGYIFAECWGHSRVFTDEHGGVVFTDSSDLGLSAWSLLKAVLILLLFRFVEKLLLIAHFSSYSLNKQNKQL